MSQIECEVHFFDKDNGQGRGKTTPAVRITCGKCMYEVEVFGQGSDSIKRGLATLREECPQGKKNWYVEES